MNCGCYNIVLGGANVSQQEIDLIKGEIAKLKARPDNDTLYDDAEVKAKIAELEGVLEELKNKTDNDTVYDDTGLVGKVTALENDVTELKAKEDKDEQTLSLNGRTLTISDGNSVELPEDRDTVYDDTELVKRLTALEGSITSTTVNGYKVEFVQKENKMFLEITDPEGTKTEHPMPSETVQATENVTLEPLKEGNVLKGIKFKTADGEITLTPPKLLKVVGIKNSSVYTFVNNFNGKNIMNMKLVDGNDHNGSSFTVPNAELNLTTLRDSFVDNEGNKVPLTHYPRFTLYLMFDVGQINNIEGGDLEKRHSYHQSYNLCTNNHSIAYQTYTFRENDAFMDINFQIKIHIDEKGGKDALIYFEPTAYFPQILPSKFREKNNVSLWNTGMTFLKHTPVTGDEITLNFPTKPDDRYIDTYNVKFHSISMQLLNYYNYGYKYEEVTV